MATSVYGTTISDIKCGEEKLVARIVSLVEKIPIENSLNRRKIDGCHELKILQLKRRGQKIQLCILFLTLNISILTSIVQE